MVDSTEKFVNNLHTLPPRDDMTVEQVLAHCMNEAKSGMLVSALVVGLNEDGRLIIRTSEMSRETANWLMDQGKLNALGRL